jgi:uracil-DNA glycosylase family 4
MEQESVMNAAKAARQMRQRLESLRSAGIEFLPAGPIQMPGTPAIADPLPHEALPDVNDGVAGIDQRRVALKTLAEQVSGCVRCKELASTRTQTVFGVGSIGPDVCFIGEAPGRDEDLQGEPFVGAAGQLLNRIISAAGMKREEVYICNILRCRPPGNRAPKPEEAANCQEWLERTLELVRPRFICTLGASAARFLLGLGPTVTIGKLRGRFYEYRNIPVLCTYHPSYLLRIEDERRKNDEKRKVWEDMKMLLTRMGKAIPEKG